MVFLLGLISLDTMITSGKNLQSNSNHKRLTKNKIPPSVICLLGKYFFRRNFSSMSFRAIMWSEILLTDLIFTIIFNFSKTKMKFLEDFCISWLSMMRQAAFKTIGFLFGIICHFLGPFKWLRSSFLSHKTLNQI